MATRTLSDEIAAHHEAGHAAVDLHFEHQVDWLTIELGEDSAGNVSAGHVQTDQKELDAMQYEDDQVRQVPFERHIMAALAGVIAQRKYAPESVVDDHGAEDRRLARQYFDALGVWEEEELQAYSHLLELRTTRLLERLWPRVQRLAAALLERRTLTGDEAKRVFNGEDESEDESEDADLATWCYEVAEAVGNLMERMVRRLPPERQELVDRELCQQGSRRGLLVTEDEEGTPRIHLVVEHVAGELLRVAQVDVEGSARSRA
jgi:hypothetical protein